MALFSRTLGPQVGYAGLKQRDNTNRSSTVMDKNSPTGDKPSSATRSTDSPNPNSDTLPGSAPRRLTPDEIEALRQETRGAIKRAAELRAMETQ